MGNIVECFGNIPPQLQTEALKFVSKITARPTEEISLLITDTVRYWRFKNQVKILEKAEKDLEKVGLSPKQVPIKFIVPFLEGCSLEEDENMQDRWSALLSNAANPTNTNFILPSYIDILKQLSSTEAKILDILFDTYTDNEFHIRELYEYEDTLRCYGNLSNENFKKISYEHFSRLKSLELDEKEISIYIDNFIRLRLLKSNFSETLHETLSRERRHSSYMRNNHDYCNYLDNELDIMERDIVQFTPMGIDFIKVCRNK
ncbi:Abi-alpha family protein [Clostridium sporogenes]|uniref:Abi-alpha family protein n=1 Tax=Clostridium sporogenes TaxID=1509 RepID=UPI001F34326D|nr:Abi-alpha family protein [Clostridium sporogenes]UJA30849.1 DUF4393 domain-containing protein [Clostridium sporogenes]